MFYKIEAELNTRFSDITFLKKSIPMFSFDGNKLKLKERSIIKVEMPFVEELSGLGISSSLMLDLLLPKTVQQNLSNFQY